MGQNITIHNKDKITTNKEKTKKTNEHNYIYMKPNKPKKETKLVKKERKKKKKRSLEIIAIKQMLK